MTVTSYTEAKQRLNVLCKHTVESREPVFIQRPGKEDVVLLPVEEYESLAETAHLLASPENAARLLAALASARKGRTKPMSLEELRAAVGL